MWLAFPLVIGPEIPIYFSWITDETLVIKTFFKVTWLKIGGRQIKIQISFNFFQEVFLSTTNWPHVHYTEYFIVLYAEPSLKDVY